MCNAWGLSERGCRVHMLCLGLDVNSGGHVEPGILRHAEDSRLVPAPLERALQRLHASQEQQAQ